ncbi:MAG: phosphoenolpyruvate carboxylase [Deltaproteobacteria bacterium]|nr:phosphoenolpyruvate carboxylase [Deltaproteobacteria bacterium]
MIKIPRTLATQHPDNANIPYWNSDAFVSTAKEVEECYRSFADLACDEYMWDWEGKFVDEAVVDRLYSKYYDYFYTHPLGKEKRLTFRVPNISKEGPSRLSRAFSGILSASYSASELKLYSPPIFEVIHPMTQSSSELIQLQKKFMETARFQAKIFGVKKLNPDHLEIIPLIEGTDSLLKSRKILEQYTQFMHKLSGKRPTWIRPFIARSDPALDGGFLAAVLSAKAALSEYFKFERDTGIKVYPMIGTGSLPFRGGLNPKSISGFIKTYPGISTVTLQSAFRYDYPLEEVKKAIAWLNKKLPDSGRCIYNEHEMRELHTLDAIFVRHYRNTIEELSEFVNSIARHIPARRERIQHTGHFGYSRQVGKAGIKLPRAITFTAVFYSIGVPPELIGLGRGLKEAEDRGLTPALEKLYPQLKEDLQNISCYLNRENLEQLAKKIEPFQEVQKGMVHVENYLGTKLGPRKHEDFLHRNYTSNVLRRFFMKQELQEDIVQAAKIRHSIG